jgi:hypothetical protein
VSAIAADLAMSALRHHHHGANRAPLTVIASSAVAVMSDAPSFKREARSPLRFRASFILTGRTYAIAPLP